MFPKQFLYPILTAVAIVLLVNVLILPEFGSTYLGQTTIETLQTTLQVQKDANALFVAYASRSSAANDTKLRELTAAKSELRKKVAGCKAALTECSFELAFSVLAPWELRPVASKGITKLVANTVSLVGACESGYALLGRPEKDIAKEKDAGKGKDAGKKKAETPVEEVDIDMLRPKREIESGDERLLRYLLRR